MTFAEALRLLEARQEIKWKLGLTRIKALLAALGDPQDAVPVIHVAGTNGKGSVCSLLASVLQAAGLRTGLFTSPHLASPLERIRVDGKNIRGEDFGRLAERVRRTEPEEASYFEMITAMAFEHFRERRVDAAVIEVGLGGRLDATNTVRSPLLSVITSISRDHTGILGDTLEAIAGEKAGIVKPGTPCLCGESGPGPAAVIRARAEALGAPFSDAVPALETVAEDWEKGAQSVRAPDGSLLRVGLIGDAAARNASLALAGAQLLRSRGLDIPDRAVEAGLASVYWPCRFQVAGLPGGRTVVLDAAHNMASIEAFSAVWRRSPWKESSPLFVLGLLRDKDIGGIVRALAPDLGRVIATQPDSHRAFPAVELSRELESAGCGEVVLEPDPVKAWKRWEDSGAAAGAVCGSIYLVGRIWASVGRIPA